MKQNMRYQKGYILFISVIIILIVSAAPLSAMWQEKQEKYSDYFDHIIIQNNILHVGNNERGSFDSIQEAVLAANEGDTILVYDDSSPYLERVTITKSVILTGENKETTIIDGENNGAVVTITADDVNISGFSIQNAGYTSNAAGIKINADNVAVSDMIITNSHTGIACEFAHDITLSDIGINTCPTMGVLIYDSSQVQIDTTSVTASSTGISLSHSSTYTTIYATTIQECDIGLNLHEVMFTSVYWNVFADNIQGILLQQADQNEINNENVIINNDQGIVLLNADDNEIYDNNLIENNRIGIHLLSASGNNIHENTIVSNEYGIQINQSSQNDVYWNAIMNNMYGLYVSSSTGVQVFLNNLSDNYQYALYLSYCMNTKVAYNNFIENYFTASFIQTLFSRNVWKKNYWDDWSGRGKYEIEGELDSFLPRTHWTVKDNQPTDNPYDI